MRTAGSRANVSAAVLNPIRIKHERSRLRVETVGEGAFRTIERDVVQRELREGGVVALGGGAVLDESTRAALAG